MTLGILYSDGKFFLMLVAVSAAASFLISFYMYVGIIYTGIYTFLP